MRRIQRKRDDDFVGFDVDMFAESAVLAERAVAGWREDAPREERRPPEVIYGVRNGLLLSALLWALLLLAVRAFL